MIKKEKSQSTQTVPTLQQEQYKYLNFFSENLLKVDTQNFLGGTVGGTVHTLCFFLELRISQGNSQRNSSGALTFLYTQSFLGRNSQKNHPVCILLKYFAINTSQRYISLLITRSNEYHYIWGVSRLFFCYLHPPYRKQWGLFLLMQVIFVIVRH